jgi:hypothetical protein
MEGRPTREFGKRAPAVVPPTAPVKRSRHVALLLMGAFAVGGGAYALMPGENCQTPSPGAALPSAPTGSACASRGVSSGTGRGGWGNSSARSNFLGGAPASSRESTAAPDSGAASVSRGGFGGFARAFTAHFSGGG